MKRILTFVGIFLVVLISVILLNRDDITRTITVSGECLTSVPRDKTAITLRVTTLADTAAQSMRDATAQMAEITEYLKSQPVEMQTTQFNSYEKTEWNREQQKSVTLGIETTIAVEVSADNIETIEKILTQFAGQTNVFSEDLRMYTSPETLKPIVEDCMGRAVENARSRANALAAGDGKRAGKMIAVSYGTETGGVVRTTSTLMRSAKLEVATAMDAAGTIVSRDTDVSVNVSAIFEIR